MLKARTPDAGEASEALLLAKFSMPKQPGLLVPRWRLFDRLNQGMAGPVTVVCGPAGSGKTTLVASWIAHDLPTGPVAWLTLDPADNDPGRFWTYVVEALRRHGAALPPQLGHGLHPEVVDRSFLKALAHALGLGPQSVVLVLDQLEVVTNPEILRDLDFVLRIAAPELRVVLTTRRQPAGPFSQDVLQGELTQIRADELAFRTDEAAALLAQNDVELASETLDRLQRHVEGWAAGLRLCALAMHKGVDPADLVAHLPASDTALTDYLVDEVLDRQPAPVRRFLRRTGVVDQVSPELADALTGGSESALVLEQLTKEHALVEAVPADDADAGATSWYRYHPLLAQVLRTELDRRHPGAVAVQHARAARWYAKRGDHLTAARHFAAAAEWGAACSAIVRSLCIVEVLEGRAPAALTDVVDAVPDEATGAAVQIVTAARAVAALRLDEASARLSDAEGSLSAVPAEDRSVFAAGAALVKVVLARRLLDSGMALEACSDLDRHLARLPFRGSAVAHARALALSHLSGTQLWTEDFDGAAGTLQAALEAGQVPGCESALHTVLGQMALWALRHGELREAARLAQQALDLPHDSGLPAPYQSGVAHLTLAMVALERNDRPEIDRHLDDADLTAEAAVDPALGAVVAMSRALWLAMAGEPSDALAEVTRAQAHADSCALPARAADRIAVAEAVVRLRCDDLQGAAAALSKAPSHTPGWCLARARLAYAEGAVETARRSVETVLAGREAAGHGDLVEALLLSARMYGDSGDVPASRRAVLEALEAGRPPEGRRRPFLEAWPWLGPIVEDDPTLLKAAAWVGPPRIPRQRDPGDPAVAPSALVL